MFYFEPFKVNIYIYDSISDLSIFWLNIKCFILPFVYKPSDNLSNGWKNQSIRAWFCFTATGVVEFYCSLMMCCMKARLQGDLQQAVGKLTRCATIFIGQSDVWEISLGWLLFAMYTCSRYIYRRYVYTVYTWHITSDITSWTTTL